MQPPPDHAEVTAALEAVGEVTAASELHGALTGLLCAAGDAPGGDWPQRLALELSPADVAAHPPLAALAGHVRGQFDFAPARVEPLLPAEPLQARAQGLVEWCRGFLGGLGLAGHPSAGQSGSTAGELIADLGVIAATRLDEGAEDDDADFETVLDFIQSAVAVLHHELHETAPPGARRH